MEKDDIITEAETIMKRKKTIILFYVLCFFIFSGYLKALNKPKIVFDNKKIDSQTTIKKILNNCQGREVVFEILRNGEIFKKKVRIF